MIKNDDAKTNEPVEESMSIFELPEMEKEEERITVKKKIKHVIGKVSAEKLNIREEPDKDADVILIVDKGTPVTIDEAGSTSKFYKVTVQGLVGYCMKEFITLE